MILMCSKADCNELTCDTMVGLCSRIRSIMERAAFCLATLEDLEATVNGYIKAWGWCLPTSVRRLLIFRRMLAWGVWMRAMICSQVK